MDEEIDSQFIADNVGFLDNCFDNSFTLQSSIVAVKEYVTEEYSERVITKLSGLKPSNKVNTTLQNNTLPFNHSSCKNETILTQLRDKTTIINKNLKDWGLPHEIASKYESRGISEMFEWQVNCLGNIKVLMNCANLVYSAPTSAGKTLVAEILTIKTVLERQKKVIIILPFVSIVREKMFYLQDILSSSGIRVEGFMGAQSPPGGLQAIHIAICTIEKANSLVNKLLDEGNISELGAIVVDELHLLGDTHRGYILELLLTKIKYVSSMLDDVHVQIVGMSATLPNLEVLAKWLDAELFITQFRPIPLDEFCLIKNKLYDKQGRAAGTIDGISTDAGDADNVQRICFNTIKDGCSVLIFCMTKNRCENLAQTISASFYKLGCSHDEMGQVLRKQLNPDKIMEVLEQLKNCPVGLDAVIKNSISFGVAYHHAGLTFDERDIIEGGFKSGAIRVLVATSTLSSGVNLPARKVIIRSPMFQRQPINIMTYKQMIGRAGRMGKDSKGESILVCTEAEKKVGFELMMGALDPVKSCIESEDKYMRAVLEMIASQVACTKEELVLYSQCTLLSVQEEVSPSQNLLDNTLKELNNFELIRIQIDGMVEKYVATPLGKACLSSSMAPNDGLSLFCELQKARQCLVLETDLHLIYLVTPYSVSGQWGENIDWLHLLTLWESLTKAMKRVGELVGVQESFIIRCMRGTNKLANVQNKINIHKRFYTALALQDLVNEVPLSEVAVKFQCARGFLQSLQQAAATFAGMVTAFCHQLGWKNMEMLISQFQDRLHFGIHSELLDLMKLPSLNGTRARTLFDAGYETVSSIASAEVNAIENTLHKSIPFQSEREREGDDSTDVRKRQKIKNIWITGCCGMTAKEAAENLISEARKYLEQEIGVTEIKWKQIGSTRDSSQSSEGDSKDKTKSGTTDQDSIKHETLRDNNGSSEKLVKIEDSEDIYLSAKTSPPNLVKDELEKSEDTNDYNNKTSGFKSQVIDVLTENQPNNSKCNSQKPANSQNKINFTNSPSILKDDIIWDSMNFTDVAIENVTKNNLPNKMFSPNISFGDTDHKSLVECDKKDKDFLKTISVKDVSLFSSDGDNSSLFEDSLPLDLIPSKLLDDKCLLTHVSKVSKEETASDFLTINSNSIINAFKTTVIETDEDEDIKLIYDDDLKSSENELDINSSDVEVLGTQNTNVIKIKNKFKSPCKRLADSNGKYCRGPLSKKLKKATSSPLSSSPEIASYTLPKIHNNIVKDILLKYEKSKSFTLKLNAHEFKCYVLRDTDIIENLPLFGRFQKVALCLDVKAVPLYNEVIGNNIMKQSEPSEKKFGNDCLIRTIAIYFGQEIIILDLSSLKEFSSVKLELIKWLKNTGYWIMISYKSNFTQVKKCFDLDLGMFCDDISLAEWLIHSDEKIPSLHNLTKKYCDVDLLSPALSLKINNREKKYKSLDIIENLCIRVWCVWHIAEAQKICLKKQYKDYQDAFDIELHVSKILAECEYYGITVDKDLASQLLIDVKSTQEALQKKAFQICGHHFNFNSSKAVAKVLGLYKGRKVSTKKSVLTSHNSPMASIIIYWRKLNSILTKTLYPLTEKACIYSHDNRITPSYTMYTCTGRISMHEPNLQNVPRTFSIPAGFLDDENTGVLEFNCRNIFRAADGCVLVSADYCQLEMRILTHYCRDDVLTKIMRSDVDVFKSIAASWGNVEENEVDDDLRQKAKQLCYGILYGMGNKTLALHLDVTELEAAVFMDTFYQTYPAIKVFTQSVVEECKKRGSVETLMKRRRYLPDVNSSTVSLKGTAERQAVNTTIQGSAADIAKAAMCAIDNNTKGAILNRLILQMHDELIYEVPIESKISFAKILKRSMEGTVRLNVPLPVKVRAGNTWGTLEEITV